MRLAWLDIPVENLERATKFYSTVFNLSGLESFELPVGGQMVILTSSENPDGPGISLTKMEGFEPAGKRGMWPYFDASHDFEAIEGRIVAAGGEIVDGRMEIEGFGVFTNFMDTEGNLVAIHTPALG